MHETPASAEAAFYAAFEARDLGAMMAVWAERAPVLCIHPMGAPIAGRAAVAASWRSIFHDAAPVRFTLTDQLVVEDERVAVRYVHENIHHGPGLRALSIVLATNVYVREDGGWRMVSHHASPGRGDVEPAPAGAVH